MRILLACFMDGLSINKPHQLLVFWILRMTVSFRKMLAVTEDAIIIAHTGTKAKHSEKIYSLPGLSKNIKI
jgi:hypothetical protein